MAESVRVDGFDDLARTLKASGSDLESLPEANASAGKVAAAAARTRAPRRTGRLAASIAPVVAKDGVFIAAAERYAPFVEYGTRHMSAEPFMTPGILESEDAWLGAYHTGVDRVLGKVHGA